MSPYDWRKRLRGRPSYGVPAVPGAYDRRRRRTLGVTNAVKTKLTEIGAVCHSKGAVRRYLPVEPDDQPEVLTLRGCRSALWFLKAARTNILFPKSAIARTGPLRQGLLVTTLNGNRYARGSRGRDERCEP